MNAGDNSSNNKENPHDNNKPQPHMVKDNKNEKSWIEALRQWLREAIA